MEITTHKQKFGFTILELLVSVGIIAGISIVVAQALFTTSKTNSKVEVSKEVKQNGEYVLQVLERKIRNAHDVSSGCAVSPGTTSASVTLTNPDESTTTIDCHNDGIANRIRQTITTPSTTTSTYLTSDSVTLSTCAVPTIQFVCVSSPSLSKSVVASFTLVQVGTSPTVYEQSSGTFQTTITLRNQ